MLVAYEFPTLSNMFDRIALPDSVIAIDLVEGATVEEEIPTVDPTLASLRLFVEGNNAVVLKGDPAKTRWRADSCDRVTGIAAVMHHADILCGGVHTGNNWRSAGVTNGVGRSDEGQCWADDRIAWSDP